MDAFDYQAQTWVSGRAGDKLALEQTRKELALVRSENGAQYLASIYVTGQTTIQSYTAILEAQVNRLERELAKGGE